MPTLGEDDPTRPEPDPTIPTPDVDPLVAYGVPTKTVGVEPIPAGATPATLTARLDTLTNQACALGWITDASLCATLRGHLAAQPARLAAFKTDVASGHATGGPVGDNAYWLLTVNADYIISLTAPPASQAVFLHGSGATANPATLSLDAASPGGTSAKYKDSQAIRFTGGNPWQVLGTWVAPPSLVTGALAAVSGVDAWVGLRNSDDVGTNFDLRVEVYKNGAMVASGETRCVQGVTLNPASAKKVVVSIAPFSATTFNGTTDMLSLKELTRVGTNAAGSACGGHTNAVGLRSYFDAASRPAGFTVTF